MLPSQTLLSDCMDAMCEISPETPSDSEEDEDPAYQNMNNALLGCLVQPPLWWFAGVLFNRRRAGPSVLVLPLCAGPHV